MHKHEPWSRAGGGGVEKKQPRSRHSACAPHSGRERSATFYNHLCAHSRVTSLAAEPSPRAQKTSTEAPCSSGSFGLSGRAGLRTVNTFQKREAAEVTWGGRGQSGEGRGQAAPVPRSCCVESQGGRRRKAVLCAEAASGGRKSGVQPNRGLPLDLVETLPLPPSSVSGCAAEARRGDALPAGRPHHRLRCCLHRRGRGLRRVLESQPPSSTFASEVGPLTGGPRLGMSRAACFVYS